MYWRSIVRSTNGADAMNADNASVVVALGALILPLVLAWWLLRIDERLKSRRRHDDSAPPPVDRLDP
jgi:ABC-type sulfate transport system permease component